MGKVWSVIAAVLAKEGEERKAKQAQQLTEDGLIPVSRISPSRSHSPLSEMGKSRSPARTKVSMTSVHDLEDNTCKLNPKVEGTLL